MNKDRYIQILEDKLQFNEILIRQLSDVISIQEKKIHLQEEEIEQFKSETSISKKTIESLEEALLKKDSSIDKLTNKNIALGKMVSKKSEKQTPDKYTALPEKTVESIATPDKITPVEKPPRKGNNNSKRKEFYNLEIIYDDKYSDDPDFNLDNSKSVSITESIIYKCIPMCFEKRITRLHTRSCNGKIYSAKAPVTPFLNSNYDASFIAGILQLKYIYSMPVERIIKFFAENNFALNKSTAHSLLRKAFVLLEKLDNVMKNAVLEDHYILMDESYHTVLIEKSEKNQKGSTKGYIWCALAMTIKLLHFFYDNGSRCKQVFLDYLPKDYEGAIASDGLEAYKSLETDEFPNAIRISCFQHCKRYFIDIEKDPDAREIINLINLLYREDHKIEDSWSEKKKLQFRKEYAPPILAKIKAKLKAVNSRPAKENPPKSVLAIAVRHMLSEFNALSNYILSSEYQLDTNAIERVMRYISLMRKNALFSGSHNGAKRSAFFFSLACSCRINNVNTFEYFSDILNRIAILPPNVDEKILRELLPDKWRKAN